MKKTKKQTPAKKASTPKSNKRTYIAIVLDKSGSMGSVHKETVHGINEQIQGIKSNAKFGGETFVTLVEFNDTANVVYKNVPAENIAEFEPQQYRPMGSTAMYDGVLEAINALKGSEEADNVGYLVVVISDGYENASRNTCQHVLAEEIQKLQNTGKWTFTYMLSNQDLAVVQQALNVPAGNMLSYSSTSRGSSLGFASNARAVSNYLVSARGMNDQAVSTFYADVDKA